MTRTSCGSVRAPPRSAIESASVCSRLSSSTSAATSSVISASSALRASKLEPAFEHLAVQRDLDVDLVVRAIDAGRIVDEVGVDPAAMLAELDPRGLGDAEIGALADRLDLEVRGVDADRVVAGIADLLLAFGARLHIGADAAEPEQVRPRRAGSR